MDTAVNTRPLLQQSETDSDFEDDSQVDRSVDNNLDNEIVVVTKDSKPLFKSREPNDRFNVAYIIFYLLGTTVLLPWFFFITAEEHMCALMAYNIECVALTNYQGDEPALDSSLQRSCLETQLMVQCCQRASAVARSIDKSIKPITHLHLEGLMKQVEMILEGSFCLPRYFFQVLQSTSVKLAITPQPRVNGEYLSVQTGSQLAVKVEGVIQHGSQPGRFRSVSGVVLTLSSQLTSRLSTDNKNGLSKGGDGQVVLRQSVTPHRDFFTGQFLLALSGGGQHQVTVEAAVQDGAGNVWTTGPRSTLTVKTLEDSSTSRARTSF